MAERATRNRRPWYEQAFAADYLARYGHRSDAAARAEAPFLLKILALPRGARVLDLCCGAGRHSRALARSGLRIIGIDLSADLLRHAAALTPKSVSAAYVRADMRRLPLGNESADGAVNLFTSFGYFSREAENARVLSEVARVLKPGAPFIMDFFNLHPTLKSLVPRSERIMGRVRLEERRTYDARSRRLEKTTRAIGGGAVRVRRESVRAYAPVELAALFRHAGLRVTARFGDLSGAPFRPRSSPRCILVARKAPARGIRGKA